MLYSKYLFCVADTWKRKYLVYLFLNKIKYYVIIGERDFKKILQGVMIFHLMEF